MMAKTFPKIIYGTAWKKEATKDLVVSAVLQGFGAIDTACQPKHYREDLVGDALQTLYDQHGRKREDIWLQTKFTSIGGQDRNKPLPYDPATSIPSQLRTSFQTSLRNLRTSYLDSYILHSPLPTLAETRAAWKELGTLRDEGAVRSIGVSNCYDVEVLRTLMEDKRVEVVQNRWFEGNEWDKEVVAYCKENGIMYQSFWTLTGSPSLLRYAVVRKIAQDLQCTPAQVIFRIAQINGITPLAGSKNEVRMHDGVATEHLNLDSYLSEPEEGLETLQKLIFK